MEARARLQAPRNPPSAALREQFTFSISLWLVGSFFGLSGAQHGQISASSTKSQRILSPGPSRPGKSPQRPCPRVDMTRDSTLAHPSTNHCPLLNFDRCSVAAGCTNTICIELSGRMRYPT
ncbi:hypothetical protein K456DRAFT_55594 [Colletotrichum gloeosporioides 23]|nr:hypothetical protein K456DRAFT_55594 [Colletotrichum gloeosporioides 23]